MPPLWKVALLVAALGASAMAGAAADYHFSRQQPYRSWMIQAGIINPPPVGRDDFRLAEAEVRPCPQEGRVIVILGQSNVANNVDVPGTFPADVTNFYDGKCYDARDPLLGASGDGGSVWSQVAWDGPVTLVPLAFGGSKMARWRPGGPLWPRLTGALAQLELRGLEPTHIVWHQGESDAMEATDPVAYEANLLAMLNGLKARTDAQIVVAQASFCRDVGSPEIVAAQARAAKVTGSVLGPNTDTLGQDMRHDNCHLNEAGAVRAAAMWAPHLQ